MDITATRNGGVDLRSRLEDLRRDLYDLGRIGRLQGR